MDLRDLCSTKGYRVFYNPPDKRGRTTIVKEGCGRKARTMGWSGIDAFGKAQIRGVFRALVAGARKHTTSAQHTILRGARGGLFYVNRAGKRVVWRRARSKYARPR
jgi:hypothetical protein